MMEAKRVSNITGYKVTNHVTDEEFNNSKLSNKSKRIEEYRNKNALICAICKTARNIKNNTVAGKRENEAYFNALSYGKPCFIKNTRAQTGT